MSSPKNVKPKRKHTDETNKSIIDNQKIIGVHQNTKTEYLSKYMNKAKCNCTSKIKESQSKNGFNSTEQFKYLKLKKFDLNQEQFLSQKYQTAVSYLRNQQNHRIGYNSFIKIFNQMNANLLLAVLNLFKIFHKIFQIVK